LVGELSFYLTLGLFWGEHEERKGCVQGNELMVRISTRIESVFFCSFEALVYLDGLDGCGTLALEAFLPFLFSFWSGVLRIGHVHGIQTGVGRHRG
jgi:hypothetical protein